MKLWRQMQGPVDMAWIPNSRGDRLPPLEPEEISNFLEGCNWATGSKSLTLPLKDVFVLRDKGGRRIFLCTDRNGQRCVLKTSPHLLRASENQPRPLNCLEEGLILQECMNPPICASIPRLLGAGSDPEDWTFLLQPFYPHEGIQSREQADLVAKKVLQVIQYLARKAILHRDIRLENLRIHGSQVIVIDFNRATRLAEPLPELFDNSDVTARGPLIIPGHDTPHRAAQSFLSLIDAINTRCGFNLSAADILRRL